MADVVFYDNHVVTNIHRFWRVDVAYAVRERLIQV